VVFFAVARRRVVAGFADDDFALDDFALDDFALDDFALDDFAREDVDFFAVEDLALLDFARVDFDAVAREDDLPVARLVAVDAVEPAAAHIFSRSFITLWFAFDASLRNCLSARSMSL
jgi:hypothetical protein